MITHVFAEAATIEEVSEIRDTCWADSFDRLRTSSGNRPAATTQ